jgi:hypothetical protein
LDGKFSRTLKLLDFLGCEPYIQFSGFSAAGQRGIPERFCCKRFCGAKALRESLKLPAQSGLKQSTPNHP